MELLKPAPWPSGLVGEGWFVSTRTAVIIVGKVLTAEAFPDSYLYSDDRPRDEHGRLTAASDCTDSVLGGVVDVVVSARLAGHDRLGCRSRWAPGRTCRPTSR